MGSISYNIPQSGAPNSTEDPKVATALQTLLTWANGNLDAVNLSAALAQAAGVNQSGQTMSGSSIIATSESRTNTAYGTLTTPDQVTGLALPAGALIAVWFQATWQESVAGAARAAIFVGSNQLKVAGFGSPVTQAAATSSSTTATPEPLVSSPIGLVALQGAVGGGSSNVTTGQVIGVAGDPLSDVFHELGGTVARAVVSSSSPATPPLIGGPCYIFAAAGTYTISVQFKASSGSVTVSNRRLYARVVAY